MATVIIFCDYTINANKNSSTDNKFCKLHFIHKQLNQAVAYTWGGGREGAIPHILTYPTYKFKEKSNFWCVVATYSLKVFFGALPQTLVVYLLPRINSTISATECKIEKTEK